jgi:hypothetical protein
MSDRCANPSCSVSRYSDKGKLFCAEIETRGTIEGPQRKIAYVWLCDGCARKMQPESEVAGEIIRVLLTEPLAALTPISPMVN